MPGNTTQYIGTRIMQLAIDGSSNNGTWEKLGGAFEFGGTDRWGEPSAITAVAFMNGALTSYDLRIQDITNGQTIAQMLGLTNTVVAIVDLGTMSSLPAGGAVWEVQGQRTGTGTKHMYLEALSVRF